MIDGLMMQAGAAVAVPTPVPAAPPAPPAPTVRATGDASVADVATRAGQADAPAAGPTVPPVDSPVATGAAAGVASTTGAQATKAPAGVSFPVRPAPTAASQAAPAVGHASAADAGSVGGALFSLVLVVALIFALGWLARRMPGMHRAAGTASLKVVASIALGPRERAVVVDVGGTQLLLGVGQGGVRTLHTLDTPLPVPAASGAPSPFAQVLAQHFGRKP